MSTLTFNPTQTESTITTDRGEPEDFKPYDTPIPATDGAITPEPLTPLEVERLDQLEEIIAKDVQTFIEVGEALNEVFEFKLYRANHANFNDYCHQRWGISYRHARRLMDAADVAKDIKGDQLVTFTSESQLRPIVRLETEQRPEAWAEATKDDPNPTAEKVEAAVQTVENKASEAEATQSTLLRKLRESKEQKAERLARKAQDETRQNAMADILQRLNQRFLTKVAIRNCKDRSGKIEIHYANETQLNRLLSLLGISEM
jgi:hypothetical protein